jgi:hypothetical protein
MSDIALRPRSATELVDAAFQVYRRDPIPFITGLALIYVPWMVLLNATGIASRVSAGAVNPDGSLSVVDLQYLMYVAFGGFVVYVLGGGISTMMAADVYFGRPADLKAAVRTTFVAFPAMFVAAVITGFLGTIGMFFLILPGLYLFGRFFATSQAILLENAGLFGAIGRSWRLTKGQVRHVINSMGLAVLLLYAILIGANLLGQLIPSNIVRMLIATIASCLAYPMVGIVATLLYYDIRIRREGFDIEYLAAATPAPMEEPSPRP